MTDIAKIEGRISRSASKKPTTKMKYEIEQFNPCEDALIFRKKYKTFRGAWNNCPRGDWMLWIAKRVGIDIRLLTLAKGYCAKTVIHLMTDQRSKDAVKAAIDYGHGKIDDVQLRNAANSAADAAKKNQKATADICRKYLTKSVMEKIKSL